MFSTLRLSIDVFVLFDKCSKEDITCVRLYFLSFAFEYIMMMGCKDMMRSLGMSLDGHDVWRKKNQAGGIMN